MPDASDKRANARSAARPAAVATRRLTLDVVREAGGWASLDGRDPARIARQVARALPARLRYPARRNAVTLVLGSDAGVRVLNRQWRGFDKATNVLSFPSPSPNSAPGRRLPLQHHLGDVIIAGETLAREAVELGITVGDHFRHLVLHGLLHLLGYDHETDEDAEEMEALETRILTRLGVADPYAGTEPLRPAASVRRRRQAAGARAR